jgi:hypothetical protein
MLKIKESWNIATLSREFATLCENLSILAIFWVYQLCQHPFMMMKNELTHEIDID